MSALDVTWTRPEWLYALAVPVALVLFHLRPTHPVDVPVGTFRLWQALATEVVGRRRARRVPPALWLTAAALALTALALAGPERRTPAPVERYAVHVDRTPSMALPVEGAAGGRTRHAAALGSLVAWCEARVRGGEVVVELEWHAAELPEPVVTRAPEVPLALRAAPAAPHAAAAAPEWGRLDVAGAVWLVDLAPAAVRAGVFASGGAAVPGEVAVLEGRYLVWDGADSLAPGEAAPRAPLVVAPEVPERLRAFARLYAEERGLTVVEGRQDVASEREPRLTLVVDTASQRAAERAAEGAPEVTPGRVVLAGTELLPHPDGAGAFAAQWAGWFDAALLPAPGVVPLAERRGAGAPAVVPPRAAPPAVPNEARRARGPLLGAMAALVALAAFVVARRP